MAGHQRRFDEPPCRSCWTAPIASRPDPTFPGRGSLTLNRSGSRGHSAATRRSAHGRARRSCSPGGPATPYCSRARSTPHRQSPGREGLFAEAVDLCRERIDLLAQAPPRVLVEVERGDALNMLSKALVPHRRTCARPCSGTSANARGNLGRPAPHIAAARVIQPLYLLGEWDKAIASGSAMREGWYAEGRPPFAPFAPDFAAVGGDPWAARRRGRLSRDWFALRRGSPARATNVPGVRMFAAEVRSASRRARPRRRADRRPLPRSSGGASRCSPDERKHSRSAADRRRGRGAELAEPRADRRPGSRSLPATPCRGDPRRRRGPMREALATFDEIECVFEWRAHRAGCWAAQRIDRAAT